MYSYGPPHMAVQKQDDQHEHTFSSYVRIRDAVLKTYLGRLTIWRSGERGSGISVLPARYDDDDDIIWLKQWKQLNISTWVDSIVVVCALTHCALFISMCNLKAIQMNVQWSLIQEFMLYKFTLGHNVVEVSKNICCVKAEGVVDHSTVTWWLKKFHSGCKNVDI